MDLSPSDVQPIGGHCIKYPKLELSFFATSEIGQIDISPFPFCALVTLCDRLSLTPATSAVTLVGDCEQC
jgi:hypothetical protein